MPLSRHNCRLYPKSETAALRQPFEGGSPDALELLGASSARSSPPTGRFLFAQNLPRLATLTDSRTAEKVVSFRHARVAFMPPARSTSRPSAKPEADSFAYALRAVPPAPRGTLRIATWNINSVRLRQGIVQKLAKLAAPDIICLQETKSPDDFFPREALAKAGYEHQAILGMKGYNGVEIGRAHV